VNPVTNERVLFAQRVAQRCNVDRTRLDAAIRGARRTRERPDPWPALPNLAQNAVRGRVAGDAARGQAVRRATRTRLPPIA
jgi:hypothetical protein